MDKKNLQRCHSYSWVNIFNIFLHHLQINLMFFFYSNICGCIYNWVQLNSIIVIKERARVQDIWDEQDIWHELVTWDSKNRKSWSKENYACTFLFYCIYNNKTNQLNDNSFVDYIWSCRKHNPKHMIISVYYTSNS